MDKIGPGCAGCYYLTEHMPARCMICREYDAYIPRKSNFGVEKEMEILGVKFDFESMVGASAIIAEAAEDRRKRERRALEKVFEYKNRLKIEKVIFNDPATIVYWRDGSKTVVKADGESFDPEKGLAMAISKKALGNEGNYYEEFKKWVPKDYIVKPVITPIAKITIDGKESIEKGLAKIKELLAKHEKESYVRSVNRDDVDSWYETLPYCGNKSYCDGKCKQCCPVDTNNKRKAGKVCKEDCCNYKKHFNN